MFQTISYCHLKPHALNVLKSQFTISLAKGYSVLHTFVFKLIWQNSTLPKCTCTAVSYTRECSWPAQRGYSPLTLATTVGEHVYILSKTWVGAIVWPFTGRHLLGVSFITSLKSNLCPALNTENIIKIAGLSHANNTTALQTNVILTRIHRLLAGAAFESGKWGDCPRPGSWGGPALQAYEFVRLYSPVNWKCWYMLRLKILLQGQIP